MDSFQPAAPEGHMAVSFIFVLSSLSTVNGMKTVTIIIIKISSLTIFIFYHIPQIIIIFRSFAIYSRFPI